MRVKSQDQNGTREVLTHELSSLGSTRPQIEPSPGPAHSAWRSRSYRGKGESCSTLVYGGNHYFDPAQSSAETPITSHPRTTMHRHPLFMMGCHRSSMPRILAPRDTMAMPSSTMVLTPERRDTAKPSSSQLCLISNQSRSPPPPISITASLGFAPTMSLVTLSLVRMHQFLLGALLHSCMVALCISSSSTGLPTPMLSTTLAPLSGGLVLLLKIRSASM